MYAAERQQAILTRARDVGSVDVDTLSTGFDVSQETIRRDLKSLENAGVVRRVHGGAIPVERLTFEPALGSARPADDRGEGSDRSRGARPSPGRGAILIDAGSTTSRLAQILPADRGLTVVTNSPAIGVLLAHRDDLTVMLLGGRLRKTHDGHRRRLGAAGDPPGARRQSRSSAPTACRSGARTHHAGPHRGQHQASHDRQRRSR